MDRLVIQGGVPLTGRVAVSGAKNAALPCIAAALLGGEQVTLRHLPAVSDIRTMLRVLQALGCTAEVTKDEEGFELTAVVDAAGVAGGGLQAPYDLVKTMRASILVLGPLLARYGKASVSLPGGCAIGARPVNLHLEALERMGAVIEIDRGYVEAHVPAGRLKGIDHTFEKVSVGATENILMAACLATGTTVLRNAAMEPEIGDLAGMLVAMGAPIEGIGTSTLTIRGVDALGGCDHGIIPDRIEAGTFLCAVAAAGGDVLLERVEPDHLRSIIDLLERCGCVFTEREGQEGLNLRIQREAGQKLHAKDVTTTPYPGFPTDLQAQVMAVMTQATGISVIRETIFENRFQHAMELERLGANLRIDGGTAIVAGPSALTGCTVMATDLRASATLVIAGLVARGETTVDRIYHLDRGYSGLEQKLKGLGARIERVGGGKV
ncbi:UDP-N-acetylglucosamine 1-carboxyvinyltransferase [Geothrix sp. 21YS21S-2]|uniref:UDP-N-acetylglucosamine 1-carboxyvinyltransferase n=1 Tax=Geothrix sp. 21YS21S-2 TaxID=3068893 RepID=UPI0027B9F88F|nr:UDP-N-acetylglucosamine 1-carboxyvinyltransferase [Geothrix sp. 21YS21S-2]